MSPATEIDVALCVPSPVARAVQDIRVEVLVRSIREIGLIQPINVRPLADGKFEVRGGNHRVAAYRALGLARIPAIVREADDLRAELAEIDENLVRSELSPAERDLAIARRKVVYELLHPETVHGATGRGRPKADEIRVANVGDSNSKPAERFSRATANDIGLAERTIQRSVSRVENLGEAAIAKIVGTSLDRGDEIDALVKLPEPRREELIARAAAGEEVSAKGDKGEKRGDGAPINGARALMGSRAEPDDSLDYFPTPPWATRALMERVLLLLDIPDRSMHSAWEPACGEGHIAEVLREYFPIVHASDIHDYGYATARGDFLRAASASAPIVDWIITNPPFGDLAIEFVLRARSLAPGVAMFFRTQWAVEGVERYERLFRDSPPTLCAFFSERVPLVKGRWDPEASTATAYCWLVWIDGEAPRPPLWIPPGCRAALTHSDDIERFTASPVISVSREFESRAKATEGKAGMAGVTGPVRRSTAGTGLRVGEASADLPATSEIMDVTGGESAATNSQFGPRPTSEGSGSGSSVLQIVAETEQRGNSGEPAQAQRGLVKAGDHNDRQDAAQSNADGLDIPAFLRRTPAPTPREATP